MNDMEKHNILIIGGPNTGKTHFGIQLYERINSRQFEFKIDPKNRPSDLSIFEDGLKNIYNGQRAAHTEAGANRSIELIITDEKKSEVKLAFPDYAGEQITSIVDNRKVNDLWKDYIENSTSWVLFIRLNELTPLEDIVNKGIPSAEEIQKRNSQPPPVKVSEAAFYVELLQTLAYIKGLSTFSPISQPNLTVVLSCWDELEIPKGQVPSTLLQERLPMLFDFLSNNWQNESLAVIGLSSTEKSLTDEPDDEFIDKEPINFGYYINKKGDSQRDLTLSIKDFIGHE
ncbi:TRAFAC clade GTPase domain-containing protein [Roseivirga pacifica]|uniref:TRAFAC clade GTPase domain-containing protein n=1 Tax=Roseivirga pacifica TaxID=1267423 RepID=UPI002094111E|nr:hypothetical protein [Roseivirga pacifica]MCO6360656.1 hypothetical protein [Roseivirga pacifica]MCO6368545.1 hypothetical protein [Roseivirga pacifica]MCO6372687.1 hypothetical protein [Roseivirga pacifica]MCO6376745.1 hypothetical protein [Roseivirga pacifica]MCO6377975.1 hypothetical protein [Roseivirga pacifica]